jgi:hypothetical protein
VVGRWVQRSRGCLFLQEGLQTEVKALSTLLVSVDH